MATIRAPPEIPVSQINFHYDLSLSGGPPIPCRLYFTSKSNHSLPEAAPSPPPEPQEPPSLPKRTRGRPSRIRLAQEEEYCIAMEIYSQASIDYNTQISAHRLAIQSHEMAAVVYTQDLAAQEQIPQDLKPDCIFTHGAGSQLDNPDLIAFSQGFARTHTVLCFEDRRDIEHRAASFLTLLSAFPSVTGFGGWSGGNVDAISTTSSTIVNKQIVFSYPPEGTEFNYEELLQLDEHTEVLFVGGDNDPLYHLSHLADTRRKMKAKSWWIRIAGGDDGINFDMPEKRRKICEVMGQIASSWFEEDGGEWKRSVDRTEMVVRWDERKNRVDWTGWEIGDGKEGMEDQ